MIATKKRKNTKQNFILFLFANFASPGGDSFSVFAYTEPALL
jgi:hypothetical protein